MTNADGGGAHSALTVSGLAKLLNVSESTVHRYARSGQIPGFKVGNRWRFWENDVRAALEESTDLWAPPTRGARQRYDDR